MRKNNRGFTLVELLAVIVILGLLLAIAIPSVTKYLTQSRIKTLVTTMDSYVTAVITQVNNGEYKFSDSTKVFAIPIECISLEKGGQNPFGNWYQANSSYWAYVLVHYDSDNYNYEYGFTFKDDAGYGLYPTLNSIITNSKVRTGYDDLSQPKDGYALDFVSIDKWDGFTNINTSTYLEVLVAESEGQEGNGQYTCTLCQKGDNYEAVEEEKRKKEYIPEGGEYITNDGEELDEDDRFPSEPQTGDEYVYGDYIYKYNKYTNFSYEYTDDIGWNVYDVVTHGKTKYGEILDNIAGVPVTAMNYTFFVQTNMVESPKIPSSIIYMKGTYFRCYGLIYPPVIPEGVKYMENTFAECRNMVVASNIPSSVVSLRRVFYDCEKLNSIVTIPTKNRIDVDGMFANCYSLITAPILPENVYIESDSSFAEGIFGGCKSLKTYVGSTDADYDFSNFHIPESITNLTSMFRNTPITDAPKPPSTATKFVSMYAGCTKLEEYSQPYPTSGTLDLSNMFYGCTGLKTFSTYVPNNCKNLNSIFQGCTSLTGTVDIRTGAYNVSISCGSAFADTVKPITLVGCSGNMKHNLVVSANNGNVS